MTTIKTVEGITVEPNAIKPSGSLDTLFIVDARTGKGIKLDEDFRWHIDLEGDDFSRTAEKVSGIYGATVEEWEAAADVKLAAFGFKLGVLDKKVGDRWELVDADLSEDDSADL